MKTMRQHSWAIPLARSLRLAGLVATLLSVIAVRAAAPVFYSDRAAFMAALSGSQTVTQNFNGFSHGANLSGATLLPGVTVDSTFSTLTVWSDGSLFGYDGATRANGQGAYFFNLAGYRAAGFDILSWDPASAGPATATVWLTNGTMHQVQRRQTGPTESSLVFFGVIADQAIVRIEWHESPETDGAGNEEVSLDNLVCAELRPVTPAIAGTWEPDTYTGHAARLVIRQSGGNWAIHGYGSCHPDFCDWGAVPLERVQPRNPGAFDGWFAKWEFSFKTTLLWLSLEGQSLVVESVDIFAEWDGREPYSMLSRMHLVPIHTQAQAQALSIQRTVTDGALALKIPAGTAVKLQFCRDLKCGIWVDVPLPAGATEHVVAPTAPQGFFRLAPVPNP